MTGAPSDDTHTASQDEAPTAAGVAAPQPATPRRPRTLARIGGFVLLALVVVFATHPWWLARVWASRLAADSKREVRIERMTLGLAAGGGVRITLAGVHVANAPWAETTKPMADLREATFVMAWASLFAERKDITRLVLVDGSVDLRRHADGRRNWRLRRPDDIGPGRYRILALEPHRLDLGFEHRGVDLVLAATARDAAESPALAPDPRASPASPAVSGAATGAASTAAASGVPAPRAEGTTTRVEIDVTWRGVPMAYRLDTGPVLTFADTGRTFPLRGTAEVGGVAVGIGGVAGDLFRDPQFDADLVLEGRSLAALAPFIGERWPGARPFRIAGRFVAKERHYALEQVTATVGRTDLAGDVAWVRSDEAPSARVALASRRAEWSDLAWLLGRTAPVAGRAAQQAKADARASKRGGTLSAAAAASAVAPVPATPASAAESLGKPSTRERLARWTAELRYEAAVFRAEAVPQLQRLKLAASLDKGRLAVPSFDVGIAGGRLQGKASAAVADPTPSAQVELQASGFRLERLLEGAGRGDAMAGGSGAEKGNAKTRATGAVSGRATLQAKGATGEAMLEALRGRASLDVRDGSISGLLDAQLGLSPGRMVRRMVAGDEAIALPCAHAVVELEGGTARIASLVVASDRTRTTGRGAIDWRRRTLEMTLTPEPVGKGGWLDLDRSIRLSGPLGKPEKALVGKVPIAATGC